MTQTKDADKAPRNAGPAADDQQRNRKLAAHFVDEVIDITHSPNGASLIHFVTWSMDDQGNPVRIDSELIMTRETIQRLRAVLSETLRRSYRIRAAG